MMVPVLLNHDHTKVIGTVVSDRQGAVISIDPSAQLNMHALFKVFGECGCMVLEFTAAKDDPHPPRHPESRMFVTRLRILEWSHVVKPAAPAPASEPYGNDL